MRAKIKSNKIRSKDDVIFDVVNYTFLTILVIIVLYPLIYVVSASFSDPSAVGNGELRLLPIRPTLEGYRRIFKDTRIWIGYWNTIIYTVVGTTLNVIMTVLCAYPLSCKNFVGRSFFTKFVIFTMYFSGGMIPMYLLMDKLHLIDTMWAIILPGMIGVHNMVITKNFFENSLPEELKEAAMLDGCSEFKYLLKFVLPLSKAVLAVIAMYYAVGHWNAFFGALIYLTDETKYPLQLVLRSILIENEMASSMMEDLNSVAQQQQYAEMIKYGVVIVSSLPVLCIYPFVQKYFVKGVMAGSVKG